MDNSELYTYLRNEKGLSDEGIDLFMTEFNTLEESEKAELIYEFIGNKVYKTMPVDINTFLDDPYFLGGLFDLYNIWRNLLNEIYPAPFRKQYNEAILSVATRCFAKGTLIRLRDGSLKEVQDIKVGDTLIGLDGSERKVTSLSKGIDKLYEVTMQNDGYAFKCNSKHILTFVNSETGEITDIEISNYVNLSESEKKKLLPLYSEAIEYEKKTLKEDPYIMGFLMLHTKDYKRIPSNYLTSSIEDRKELLAGIIDMKGEIFNNELIINVDYYTLVKDISNLAKSLGISTKITGTNVILKGKLSKIPTKILKVSDSILINDSIEARECEEGEFYGFEVDKDHRFLLENYSVTHNSGKTFVSSISVVYEIYLLTCLKDPVKFLSSSNVVIALLSKDNPTAVSQLGSEVYKGLTQSQCFKGLIRDKLSFSKLDKDGVHITDYLLMRAGSTLGTVIGTNLYTGCLDEANMPSSRVAIENLVEYRLKIYHEMLDRKAATFSRAPKMSGILWLTSSPTDEGDVIGERIDEVKSNDIPNVIIRDNVARWEAKEENMDETFSFFLGSDTKDPCILDDSIILKPEELDRVIEVPNTTEYYNNFKIDPYKSIQNIAGRRTMPETALFNTVSIFDKVFYKENNIFRKDILSIPLDKGMNVDDFLYDPTYFSHPEKPDCFRYIHLDMAYSCDKFGIASVYSDRIKYLSEEDNHEMMVRKYFVDFCLGVVSPNKEKVDIIKVLEFIYSLKEKGYPLKLVTTDNHQGELARQVMKKHGVKTDYLSIETDKNKYLNLKNLIITESLEGYKNPELIRDLRGLRESQKKIEKGKGYSDDMSNALAGALWSCCQDRFYKRNNETISELIHQTGQMLTPSNVSGRGFQGISSYLRNNKNDLGFRYH